MSTTSPAAVFPWWRAFAVRAAWAWLWAGEFNPVFVKEMRQAVRGRLVLSGFSFVLLVMFGLSASMLLTSNPDEPGLGKRLLTGQLVALTTLTGVCVPAWSRSRMLTERDGEDGIDLLYYTPMSAEEIMQGKLLSNATLAAVFFSAGAPFLAVTPLLRGVDVPTVILVTGLNYLTVVSIAQAGLVLASLPLARVWKGVLTALVAVFAGPFVLIWVVGCMAYIHTADAVGGLPLLAVAGMAAVFGPLGINVLNVMAASYLAPMNGIYFRRDRPPQPKA
jgi:hypothetical protein